MKFKDLVNDVNEEILKELADEKKEILKEKMLEIRYAEKALNTLRKQYKELLEMDLEDVD